MLAAKAFPNQSAVGKRILIRIRTPEPEWVEIIGVVAHQRVTSLADPGREQVYFADGFLGFGANKWAVRTSRRSRRSIAGAVRAAVAQVDPQFLITELQPMDALVARAQAGTRFSLMLIGVFAIMAALLVSVGSTACWRRSCASARPKSASAWRSARRRTASCGSWSATGCGSAPPASRVGLARRPRPHARR